MAALDVAAKANQAYVLPALLVAQCVNQSHSIALFDIKYADIEALYPDQYLRLIPEDGPVSFLSKDIIKYIIKSYPFLQGKHHDLVC